MILNYFPGCTLKNKAADLDFFARESAKFLGIELKEIPEWQCCGGVFNSSKDDIANKLSSIRALTFAEKTSTPICTVCSACHNVLKQVNYQFNDDPFFAERVNLYMGEDDHYNGTGEVVHFLEVLRDYVGWNKIAEKVINPIGKKIGAYYGCLLLRPSKVMTFDDPENPSIIEDFIRAIGGEPIIYPQRNECCGGYVTLEDKEFVSKKSAGVISSAKNHDAELLVTACPLCKYNLEKTNGDLPIIYFTELLYKALGLGGAND